MDNRDTVGKLACDMLSECTTPSTYIDEKGFIYCEAHGKDRRYSGIYCRRLRPWEIRLILAGEQVPSYKPITQAEHLKRERAKYYQEVTA
jgi:hypothetical protein